MKLKNKIGILLFSAVALTSCKDYLDPWEYTLATEQKAFELTSYLNQMPLTAYGAIPAGFNRIGSSYMTAASDESENVDDMQSIQSFNSGAWNKYSNPDDVWSSIFNGLRIANDYLQGTDTLTWRSIRYSNPTEYNTRMITLTRNRGEMHWLRGMLYFELIKRYGSVPLIKNKPNLLTVDISKYPQTPVDSIIEFIVDECDLCTGRGKYALTQAQRDTILKYNKKVLPSPYRDTVAIYYQSTGTYAGNQARNATVGSALALKAKALIYAASPQFNPTGDVEKWKRAAQACKDVIDLTTKYPSFYSLGASYKNLFLTKGVWNNEFLYARKYTSSTFDYANFPIAISGGATGTCPTSELVDEYEMRDGSKFDWSNPAHAATPYINRDPRLKFSIIVNGDSFNYNSTTKTFAKIIECWPGGNSSPDVYHGSKTSYYMRKFINETVSSNTDTKLWPYMRLTEFYLFYAEAMNEAYGPDADPLGYGLTARQAVNVIRDRADVKMPALPMGLTKAEFTEKLRHERKVELAFEDARFWDLRRWKIAENHLNGDIHGVRVTKNEDGTFKYTPNVVIEKRVFKADRMYFHPIPQTEIDKSNGVLKQNPNWDIK